MLIFRSLIKEALKGMFDPDAQLNQMRSSAFFRTISPVFGTSEQLIKGKEMIKAFV